MSERPHDSPPAEVPTPRASSVGIVIRKGRNGRWQVLLGLRARNARFLPGHWAFLGGRVDDIDRPGEEGDFLRCVVREVREESRLRIHEDRWIEVGERVTPPFFPVRYRTKFFLAQAPEGASVGSRKPPSDELEALRFVPANEAHDEWRRGAIMMPPVLPPLLSVIAEEPVLDLQQLATGLEKANTEEERAPRVEFVPGIWVLPLLSETLPPATHTNCYLAGGQSYVIVDPGSAETDELALLRTVISRRKGYGGIARGIVLTHHHRDHVAGAATIAREMNIPVKAHPRTLELLAEQLNGIETEALADGDTLDLEGISLNVLETPGHAPGHIALYCPDRDVVIAGDLLSGFSSILINPEDGDMSEYLTSLRKVRDMRAKHVFPSHGPPLPPQAPDQALDHRLHRESMVRSALSRSPKPLVEIAFDVYEDEDNIPATVSRMQTHAHLLRLQARGIAQSAGDEMNSWSLT